MRNILILASAISLLSASAFALDASSPEGEAFKLSADKACRADLEKPPFSSVVTPREVNNFCVCYVEKLMPQLTTEDLNQVILARGKLTARLQTIQVGAAEQCVVFISALNPRR